MTNREPSGRKPSGRKHTPADPGDVRVANLRRFAELLDAQFALPGTGFRFGLDGLIGLVPGVGDTLTACGSAYIVLRARTLGVRRRTLFRMVLNILIDLVIGAVPVLGDLFDFGWKANLRNIDLVQGDLGSQAAERARPFG